MTQKELFKGKIVELFNSLLPNNTIDDYSLEIVETKEHTTLFDLLNSLEGSEHPPICTRETDDAVHVIYPNITFIFPHDFKRVKLFYNSDVKIYIKRPEYVELQQLTEFISGLDSEMNHWKNMWRYFHDLDVLKLKGKLKVGEKCRKLIERIVYPFNPVRIEEQRLEYYNITASRLFVENELFDYVYQKSLDMIVERCRTHCIYPDAEEWKENFDDILKNKRLEYLIAEERRAAIKRKNEKIQHLLSLGYARIQAALAGIKWHIELVVSLHSPYIDMESSHNVLKNLSYDFEISLFGTASIRLRVPYLRLGEVIGQVVEAFKGMNALMPKLEGNLQEYGNKYMIQRNFGYNRKDSDYPFRLMPASSSLKSLLYMDLDEDHDDYKGPKNENLTAFNAILRQIKDVVNKAG